MGVADVAVFQEEYIKDEQKNLKRELLRAQEEVKRIQAVPLVIGQFLEPIDEHHGIVGTGFIVVQASLGLTDAPLCRLDNWVQLLCAYSEHD